MEEKQKLIQEKGILQPKNDVPCKKLQKYDKNGIIMLYSNEKVKEWN